MTKGPDHTRLRGEPVCGAVAVAERDGTLLMIRRAPGIPASGRWCFPGGALQKGETSAQAVVREMGEELGVIVDPLKPVFRWTRPDRRLVLVYWTVCLRDDSFSPDPREVREVRWMTADEIRGLPDGMPSNVDFLEFRRGVAAARATDAIRRTT